MYIHRTIFIGTNIDMVSSSRNEGSVDCEEIVCRERKEGGVVVP